MLRINQELSTQIQIYKHKSEDIHQSEIKNAQIRSCSQIKKLVRIEFLVNHCHKLSCYMNPLRCLQQDYKQESLHRSHLKPLLC